jgi:8-oxo-dGTP pyrophosphatase MutT (NUDIX family)
MTDRPAVHPLTPAPVVAVTREMRPLPPALDAEVTRLWQEAQARMAQGGAGALFNGRVFSADAIAPDRIEGHLTEFRRIVAQMARPDLFEALRLRPLAVNGVLRCADGVAFGRRHPGAVYQPGLWQMPPAGSVDGGAIGADGAADLRAALLAELREELGLPAESVAAPRALAIVEHEGSHVLDLGMELRNNWSGSAVLDAHARLGNREYAPLLIVPEHELSAFLAAQAGEVVPSARVFLHALGLIGDC